MRKVIEETKELSKLEKTEKLFLEKFILIYGARNTGKTTITFEMMYYLRNMVERVFVISQSATANNQFRNIVPNKAVLSQVTVEWFKSLMDEQKKIAERYNKAMSLEYLRDLYKLVETKETYIKEKNAIRKSDDFIEKARRSGLDEDSVSFEIQKIKRLRESYLTKLYVDTITENYEYIERMPNLSTRQKFTHITIKKNPQLLIIFDDCASIFNEWAHKIPEIGEIIYNGRHYKTTMIITTQDDSEIVPKYRKQAQLSIFTDKTMAASFFSRSERRNETKAARDAINYVWGNGATIKKMVHLSEALNGSNFSYMTVAYRDKFTIGGKKFWQEMKEKEEKERKRLTL